MGDANRSEVPPGLVSGRLEGVSLPDLLWGICRRGKTGVLRLLKDGIRKSVYIQDGRIVFATSGDPDDRIGEYLLRERLVLLDDLEGTANRQQSGTRLGEMLVEAGHLSPDDLRKGVVSQVRSIVLSLFTWGDGEYRFDEGPLPTQEVITLDMNTGEILLQGIRRIRSFSRVRRSVGPPRTYYELTANWREALSDLSLTDGEQTLVSRLAEGGETVARLCEEVFLSNFEIYQTLWALKVLGAIVEGDRPADAILEASLEARLDTRGLAPVLIRLCRTGETGVLFVIRGSRERTIHIKEGNIVFVTSNDLEDGLLAHLLRRGVISLRDHEETTKRLLSNKRVGTILRERGVIDDEDLRSMVCEQLREILYDTFRWNSGEYLFVSGELPTIEEITLDTSLESLVAEGLRRSGSWSRVHEGCGGPNAVHSLTPNYLEVLDRMDAGTEEWDVASCLKQPRAVREVCRSLELGDYDVCQTLWILKTLGAVEQIEVVEEAVEEIPFAAEEEEEEAVTEEAVTEEAAVEAGSFESEPEGPVHSTAYIPREKVQAALIGDAREDETPTPEVTATGQEQEQEQEIPPSPEERDGEAGEERPSPYFGGTTTVIPRDVVEAAIGSDEEPEAMSAEDAEEAAEEEEEEEEEEEAEVPPDWDPPADLEEQIARLNARQRVLFRTIRAEVGAGATNFVQSCIDELDVFSGAELRADGTWDEESLTRAVIDHRIEDPWPQYERLLDLEIEALRSHIGEPRAERLRRRVEEAEPQSAA